MLCGKKFAERLVVVFIWFSINGRPALGALRNVCNVSGSMYYAAEVARSVGSHLYLPFLVPQPYPIGEIVNADIKKLQTN